MNRAIPALCAAVALCLSGATAAAAQDHAPLAAPEPAPPDWQLPDRQTQDPSSNSATPETIARIRQALSRQPLVTTGTSLFEQPGPDERHIGVVTFVQPDTRGELVRIRVPIGELVMDGVHSVAAFQHRRAEKSAREEVAKALADFLQAQVAK